MLQQKLMLLLMLIPFVVLAMSIISANQATKISFIVPVDDLVCGATNKYCSDCCTSGLFLSAVKNRTVKLAHR